MALVVTFVVLLTLQVAVASPAPPTPPSPPNDAGDSTVGGPGASGAQPPQSVDEAGSSEKRTKGSSKNGPSTAANAGAGPANTNSPDPPAPASPATPDAPGTNPTKGPSDSGAPEAPGTSGGDDGPQKPDTPTGPPVDSPANDRAGGPAENSQGNENAGGPPVETPANENAGRPDSPGASAAAGAGSPPFSVDHDTVATPGGAVVSVSHRDVPGRPGTIPGAGAPGADHRPSVATAVVSGASANEPVTVPVAVGSPSAGVGVASLSMDVDSDRSYDLEVAADDRAFATTPDFLPASAVQAIGFVRVDHSVPDEEIGDVDFEFSLSRDRISGADVEQVALYRYHDGEWTELETHVVRETATEFVFNAKSPGLSEFVVGKKRATFDVVRSSVDTMELDSGTLVTVRLLVSNTGEASGTYDAVLHLDGDRVLQRTVSVAPGGTRQITLSYTVTTAGTHTLEVPGVLRSVVVADGAPADPPSTTQRLQAAAFAFPGVGLGLFAAFAALVLASTYRLE